MDKTATHREWALIWEEVAYAILEAAKINTAMPRICNLSHTDLYIPIEKKNLRRVV